MTYMRLRRISSSRYTVQVLRGKRMHRLAEIRRTRTGQAKLSLTASVNRDQLGCLSVLLADMETERGRKAQ